MFHLSNRISLDMYGQLSDAVLLLKGDCLYFYNKIAAKHFYLSYEFIGTRALSVFPDIMNALEQGKHFLVINNLSFGLSAYYCVEDGERYTAIVCKESGDLYRDVFHSSFDGILVTDADANILMVNQSYERITGIKVKDMLGKNMRDIYNLVWLKQSVAELVVKYNQPVSKKQITQLGTEIVVTGKPLLSENDTVRMIIINVRDIPEIYQLQEDEIQRIREEKRKSNLSIDVSPNEQVVVASEAARRVFALAKKVGNFQSTVLILGESGAGKEAIAQYIHQNSIRKGQPYITINCGSIPNSLLESELFGYEKGAFTGALQKGKKGLLEAANGGTVFLDEIGEISPDFQVKILRVLESKEILPVGSVKSKQIDIRIVAATNRDLKQMVQEGSFREDLYYRLNVIELYMPPLRERTEDIRPLCYYFLKRYNNIYGQDKKFTPDALREMERYHWPGNVRQLKNAVERMVLMSSSEFIQQYDLPWYSNKQKESADNVIREIIQSESINLKEAVDALERQLFVNAQMRYKTTREIAASLGVDQSTAVRKLKKFGLT